MTMELGDMPLMATVEETFPDGVNLDTSGDPFSRSDGWKGDQEPPWRDLATGHCLIVSRGEGFAAYWSAILYSRLHLPGRAHVLRPTPAGDAAIIRVK